MKSLQRTPRFGRGKVLQALLDALTLSLAFVVAYLLRFDFHLTAEVIYRMSAQLPLVVLIQLLALRLFRTHAFIWRYIGLREVLPFLIAIGAASVPLFVGRLLLPTDFAALRVPLSVTIIDAVLAFSGVLGLRVLRRVLHENGERGRRNSTPAHQCSRTLLIGAGSAGILAAKAFGRKDSLIQVCGFVDDDPEKAGMVVQGYRVLGSTADLGRLVPEHEIDQVIITISTASRADMDRIVAACEQLDLRARIIPPIEDILSGKVEVNRIRDVQIEDLLSRESVELDEDNLRTFLGNRVVLVSGAGGSIGSELCRQVIRFHPARLVLVERSEGALYNVHRELIGQCGSVDLAPALVDVSDKTQLRQLMLRHRPQVVLHAAAHKHVPLLEQNPLEGIRNNVLGTLSIAECSHESGAASFVLISTDKAVEPSSVMGATKRVAELIVEDMNRRSNTKFSAVRFGNVMGSNGSVIPLFREQIKHGGPVTVTHPDMERYFMTIPEASQLVLQAGAMGVGGEVFVLDMGEPMKIIDLARRMIQLSGLRESFDVKIEISGVRPGEKLTEILAGPSESLGLTRHPKIMTGRLDGLGGRTLTPYVLRLGSAIDDDDSNAGIHLLAEMIPEHRLEMPSATAPIPLPLSRPDAFAATPNPRPLTS
jgi:FlaA1/EpsC-like NDP-sugar epimerase